MKIVLFAQTRTMERSSGLETKIRETLLNVSRDTNTDDLVVALYLVRGRHRIRGTAYARFWMTPETFIARRGKWTFTRNWKTPDDLPDRFKLIRMRLDGDMASYPRTETDRYGWQFRYRTFYDHLATLFAHELPHYRRYHLHFHPREGEHAANRWALSHVQNAGHRVEGKRLPNTKKRRSIQSRFLKKFPHLDPFKEFRSLKAGAALIVKHDPRHRYLGQSVRVLRPIRSNSKRIVIETPDGKTWRWPMDWLKAKE